MKKSKSRIGTHTADLALQTQPDAVIEWPRTTCDYYRESMAPLHPQGSVKHTSHRRNPYSYEMNWAESVPAAMAEFAQLVVQRQKQEFRIGLLEVGFTELKAKVLQLQSCETKIAAINTFSPEPYTAWKPILVSVSSVDGGYSASWHDANVHSSGENEDEAITSLKNLVLDLFDQYSKEPAEKLGPEPKRQFVIIKEFVGKKSA